MGKHKPNPHTHTMSLKLTPQMVKALDYFALHLNCTRSRAIRYLLKEGLLRHGIYKAGGKKK